MASKASPPNLAPGSVSPATPTPAPSVSGGEIRGRTYSVLKVEIPQDKSPRTEACPNPYRILGVDTPVDSPLQ